MDAATFFSMDAARSTPIDVFKLKEHNHAVALSHLQALFSVLYRLGSAARLSGHAPFARIAEPRKRYAILLITYTAIYAVAALPIPVLPLVALAIGYIGVLAVGRAWVWNDKKRIHHR